MDLIITICCGFFSILHPLIFKHLSKKVYKNPAIEFDELEVLLKSKLSAGSIHEVYITENVHWTMLAWTLIKSGKSILKHKRS